MKNELPMDLTPEVESSHRNAQDRMAQMLNYYLWIINNFRGAQGRRIWDAGAGIGNVSELLARDADFVLATEFTDTNLQALDRRFEGHPVVRTAFCDLTSQEALAFAQYDLDTVITLDVLEHLEHDRQVLSLYHQVLRPGGRLLIKVPAHPFLYGSLDEASLHYRRYSRKELGAKLAEAGFQVERLRYMNMAATLPYLIKGRLLRRQSNFSTSLNAGRLGFYNRLMPWFERLEQLIPPPFGLSLIAVGRKSG